MLKKTYSKMKKKVKKENEITELNITKKDNNLKIENEEILRTIYRYIG